MKVALIPPIELVDYTDRTDIQLMLPHLLNSEQYRNKYREHLNNPRQYVILDNGEAEGEGFAVDDFIETVSWLEPDEIVLPDVIKDALTTQERAEEFISKWDKVPGDPAFMFVAQGLSYSEFLESAKWAGQHPDIDVIGLPRHMIETTGSFGARAAAASELRAWTDKPIHLLGGSPLLPDELDVYRHMFESSNVRSTDTSSPFNYAYTHTFLTHGEVVRRPEGYFDLPADMFDEEYIERNIADLLEWAE